MGQRFLTILLFNAVILTMVSGQNISNSSNNWYFGNKAAVTFNTNPPSVLLDGQLDTQEGVASVSDSNGELLFYTDGRTVWDKAHNQMVGPQLNGHDSSTQSALIVGHPSEENIYYIFTVDQLGGFNGLQYTLIDMSLPGNGTINDPLGDFVTASINIFLAAPVTEKITAVIKSDNSGFWIIVHSWGNDEFLIYSLGCDGLDSTPITQQIGSTHSGGINNVNAVGYMKTSTDRKKLALVNRSLNAIEIFDFDASNGMLSNPNTIVSTNESLYGLEFTFDNQYLFIGGRKTIYRFNLATNLLEEINVDDNLLGTDNVIRALQMGPDKKIYVSIRYLAFLSVIENASQPDVSLNINHLFLDPTNANRNCRFGLPTIFYFDSNPKDTSSVSICPSDTYSFEGSEYDPNSINEIYVQGTGNCDSIYILKIDTFPTYETTEVMQFCQSNFYEYMGIEVFADMDNVINLSSVQGCDSTIILLVDEVDLIEADVNVTLCDDESFEFQGVTYQNSLDSFIEVSSLLDCDSIFHLVINKSVTPIPSLISIPSCNLNNSGQIMTEIENGTIEMFDYSLDDINYTSNPNFENLPAGIYSVYLKDDLECITAFQVTVDEIIVEEINELVYIPNIFNPQSFKGNDCFKAYVSSDVVINQFHLEIYDRWGSKVFESDDIDNCWNGKFKDDPLELGVYCYILSLDYTECNEPKNTLFYGDITLIR